MATPRVIWSVGDGADGSENAHAIADMVRADKPDAFLYLGDIYSSGTHEEFIHHYAPVYGMLNNIVLPTPGNHDFPRIAEGYEPYFRKVMGARYATYYTRRLGSWQIISINSEEPHGEGSPQLEWLKAELAKKQYGKRRIAMFHRPRYCSGSHGDAPDMEPVWAALEGKCKIALSGHAHDYQRFKPERGIMQFISGAGGAAHYATLLDDPNLDFSDAVAWGALRMELSGNIARFRFVALGGKVLDEGQIDTSD